ncbi:MAG: hypothetical protein AB4038_14855 [Prochloraceae cyanobacterium]
MRSGTTWLHMNLKEHPEVWMPPIKEIHYIDEIEHLHKNFGGYASNWLDDASRLLELVS